MLDPIDDKIKVQLAQVVNTLESTLKKDLLGVYLYGSAMVGGLHKYSDVDIFVISTRATTHEEKQRLVTSLLKISGIYKTGSKRAIEMTLVVHSKINPWRYPPEFYFQYGEWLRKEFENGNYEPWSTKKMSDLALLITQILLANKTLFGTDPGQLINKMPYQDVILAMMEALDTLMPNLNSDTFNVLLTLARIWNTVETEKISSKAAAADWVISRLPEKYQFVIKRAKSIYLGEDGEYWDDIKDLIEPCAKFMISQSNQKISFMVKF